MQTANVIDRYVIARERNVLRVDFNRDPDPPAPWFPGAGALRQFAEEESSEESSVPDDAWRTRPQPAPAVAAGTGITFAFNGSALLAGREVRGGSRRA